MKTVIQHTTSETQPEKSGWYDTDKGKLYWCIVEKQWSCDGKQSYEYPKVWYVPPRPGILSTSISQCYSKGKLIPEIELFLMWIKKGMWNKYERISKRRCIETPKWYNTVNYESMDKPLTIEELYQMFQEGFEERNDMPFY